MLSRPHIWLGVTIATILISILLIVFVKPAIGIDFTGGSLLEIQSTASLDTVRAALAGSTNEATVQVTDAGSIIIKTTPLSPTEHEALLAQLQEQGIAQEELRFESIGPTIGAELKRKAWIAVSVSMVAMIIYLAYTFRQAGNFISSWKFGVAAVIALIHDLLVVTAAFALLKQFGASIDSLFVTAMLAILGYSINDTIVIFNRFKTEWLATRQRDFIPVMDAAAGKTLGRSLNTSFTTLLVLGALLLFGGETIRWFVAALAMGTIAGTYSSLFVASPMLYFLARAKK